jgi:hypothetical protein
MASREVLVEHYTYNLRHKKSRFRVPTYASRVVQRLDVMRSALLRSGPTLLGSSSSGENRRHLFANEPNYPAVGVGGGLGVTPGVALAYAVVAAGFFVVGKYGSSAASYVPRHDIPMAAPAE